MTDPEVRERVAQTEVRLLEIEALPNAQARSTAAEAVQGLLELYGEAMARMVSAAARHGSEAILETFTSDELISHLLLLHGLHPVDLETRVRQALDEVRPLLQSHGGNVELFGMEGRVVRLRMQGSCSGCPSSSVTLRTTIEEALQRAAPDLEGIEVVDEARDSVFGVGASVLTSHAQHPPPKNPLPALLQIELSPARSARGNGRITQ